MKAKITSHELLLSVGMIVKNEAKRLEKCLSALTPLLRAVPSELIVVDTGSTDGTFEIARRYTSKVCRFDWCDDFSAARNVSLDQAGGKWFLFIDADEVLDADISDLVRFLTGPDSDRYKNATLIQRNYQDRLMETYGDFNAARLFRRLPGRRFQGIIHEYITAEPPIGVVHTILHHEGYIDPVVGELRNGKLLRNKTLLERQLQQHPNDLRVIRHYADTFIPSDFHQAAQIETLLRGAFDSIRRISTGLEYSIFLELFQCLVKQGKALDAAQLVGQYREKRESYPAATDLDVTAWMGAYLRRNGRPREAVSEFEEYRRLYRLYQSGNLNTMDLFFSQLHQAAPFSYRYNTAAQASCHMALEEYAQAKELLDEADPVHTLNERGKPELLPLELEYIACSGDYGRIAADYQAYRSEGPAQTEEFARAFENAFPRLDEKKLEASRRLAALEPADAFIALNRLRAGDGGDLDGALEVLQREPDLIYGSEFFYDALYDALSNQRDISAFWEQGKPEKAPALALRMAMAHVEYPRVLYRFLFDGPREEGLPTMRSLRWWLALEERALLAPNDFTEDEYLRLFRHYAKRLFLYCQNLYNTEIWDGDDLELLPSMHQFAYHIALAEQAEQEGNDLQYVRSLRRALSVCEAMKAPVTLLLERFQNRLEQRDRDSEEFQRLIALLKEKIRELARMGLGSDAAAVLTEYARVNPMDEELDELFELVK